MKGLAAVRQRIEEAFRSLHNDQRTREQVLASQELLQVLEEPSASVQYTANAAKTFDKKANALAQIALRSPHIRPNNRNTVWTIDPVQEDWRTLCEEAVRNLEKRNE